MRDSKIIEKVLLYLCNVYDIYEKGYIFQKHSIVRVLFKKILAYSGVSFKTNSIHPAFKANALEINAKGLLFYEQAFENSNNNLDSTDQQEYFEHLNRFLLLIEPIIEDLERKKFI